MRYLPLALILLGACSYMPEPLNDPQVSTWGKKCNDNSWSYVWINNRGEDLKANKDKC